MSLGQFIWSIDKDTITSQRQNYQKGGQYKRDSKIDLPIKSILSWMVWWNGLDFIFSRLIIRKESKFTLWPDKILLLKNTTFQQTRRIQDLGVLSSSSDCQIERGIVIAIITFGRRGHTRHKCFPPRTGPRSSCQGCRRSWGKRMWRRKCCCRIRQPDGRLKRTWPANW